MRSRRGRGGSPGRSGKRGHPPPGSSGGRDASRRLHAESGDRGLHHVTGTHDQRTIAMAASDLSMPWAGGDVPQCQAVRRSEEDIEDDERRRAGLGAAIRPMSEWTPRRVVPGHTDGGGSTVLWAGAPPVVTQLPNAGVTFRRGVVDHLHPGARRRGAADPAAGPLQLPPPRGGTRIRVNEFQPRSSGGRLAVAVAPYGNRGLRDHDLGRAGAAPGGPGGAATSG